MKPGSKSLSGSGKNNKNQGYSPSLKGSL